MKRRKPAALLPHLLIGALLCASPVYAQSNSDVKVSIIYTGKSMGALSILRDPDEKELLQEEALKKNLKPKLSTFTCWRSPGVIVFDPQKDLKFSDLPQFLGANPALTAVGPVASLRSNNVTMVQYPESPSDSLLDLTFNNARRVIDFPDLLKSSATLSRVRTASGQDVLVLVEGNATLSNDINLWTEGQANRIEVGEGVVYELPVNLAEMGARGAIIDKAVADAKAAGAIPFLIDLGQKNGDFGVETEKRAEIDYDSLQSLGYQMILPYEFELGLGAKKLSELTKARGLELIASNVKSSGDDIFAKEKIIEQGGIKIGVFGIVDPDVKNKLSKAANAQLTFEATDAAVAREVKALRDKGANVVIMLSNMHPKDNAVIARENTGIDVILSDIHTRWAPETLSTQVTLSDRPYSRPGSPSLVARSFGNGLSVSQLTMNFKPSAVGGFYLSDLRHDLQSVTDRTAPKASLVAEIRKKAATSMRERGGIIFPSMEKIAAQDPVIRNLLGDTNKLSKSMWESFVAKLIRVRGGAEVSMWRRVDFFPPLVGDLDEANVRSWLWTEESFVVLDLTGKDLKAVIAADTRGVLAIDGITDGKIHALPISDTALYRVLVTDFLFDAFAPFANGKRVHTKFSIQNSGDFVADDNGKTLLLRDYVVGELYRLQKKGGDDYYASLGAFLRNEDPFEPTFTFTFDHITVFGSYNQQPSNSEAFVTLSETRANAPTNRVIGITGNLRWSYDLRKAGTDLTVSSAFSQQVVDDVRTESSDDLKFDLKERFKLKPGIKWNPQPFLGATFDTEYTPTQSVDAAGVVTVNPRQEDLSALGGFQLSPGHNITKLQLAAVATQSFGVGQTAPKVGINLETEYKKALPKFGKLSYRWTNVVNYFPVIPSPTETGLKLRYNMVHELLLPFLLDLSASVAVDLLIFQGEVEATDEVGVNGILRFGLTYDRFWKPKYQSLF